jgi:glucose/arabinose dehydrogenase
MRLAPFASRFLRSTFHPLAIATALLALPGCGDEDPADSSGNGPTSTQAGPGGGEGNSGPAGPGSGGAGVGGAGPGGSGSGASGGGFPGAHSCDAASGAVPGLQLVEVASGLSLPLLVKGAPGDTERLYVVEQTGAIRVVKNGALLPDPFLDISSEVTFESDERGLLGLAFHPDYAQNGRFFVHYSGFESRTTVSEYKRSSNPDVAEPGEVAMVFDYEQPAYNHNGGSIEFGKDGMLYIFLGDGGGSGDPFDNGQNLDSLLAKVLRIDVTTLPYQIPAGNLAGAGGEIWDYGMRNPWRASFDLCTGDLYIGDVGQGAWEEIDVEPAGQGNKNYGWRLKEGTHCYDPSDNCDPQNATVAPVIEYDHSQGGSVTGGYVYRGHSIPALRGAYLYGDFTSGRIWSFVYSGGQATAQTDHSDDLQSVDAIAISSFGQDNRGEVYVVHHGGSVYVIQPE